MARVTVSIGQGRPLTFKAGPGTTTFKEEHGIGLRRHPDSPVLGNSRSADLQYSSRGDAHCLRPRGLALLCVEPDHVILARLHSGNEQLAFFTRGLQVLTSIEDPKRRIAVIRLAKDSHGGQIGIKPEATQDDPIAPRIGEPKEVFTLRHIDFHGGIDALVAVGGGELPRGGRFAVQRDHQARAPPWRSAPP